MINKLFLFAFILLCGCKPMTIVESSLVNPKKTNEFPYNNTDFKVRYQITNDANNIHIRLNTSDSKTITKIITTGLRICFDVNGKKNEKVYFEYPVYQKQAFSDKILARSRRTLGTSMKLSDLIPQIPNEAIFSSHGVTDSLHVLPADADIKVSITSKNRSGLIYELIIPFNRISKNGVSALSKLSIGFVTQRTNVLSIANRFEDISGEDVLGDAQIGRTGNMSKARPQNVPVNSATLRLPPDNRYVNRNNPPPSRINDFWFKVHLLKVK